MTKQDVDRIFAEALDARLRAEYQRGLHDGLAVVKQLRGFLTRQPDRKWQAQARAEVDAAISKAEKL